MSKVIGIVSEGPTDYLVLKTVIDKIAGTENKYLSLQPEADLRGKFGNGWKGMFMESGNDEVFLLAEQQPSDTDYNIENARALNNETLFEVWYKDNYIL